MHLTRTSKFLSLMNPLSIQMLGESASVEIQARPSADRALAHAADGLAAPITTPPTVVSTQTGQMAYDLRQPDGAC